jgi:hypothetical protein
MEYRCGLQLERCGCGSLDASIASTQDSLADAPNHLHGAGIIALSFRLGELRLGFLLPITIMWERRRHLADGRKNSADCLVWHVGRTLVTSLLCGEIAPTAAPLHDDVSLWGGRICMKKG